MISTTVYVSTLHQELDKQEIDELLASSRAHNARNAISGMLTVRGRNVMQVLEGDEQHVRDLYTRISNDPRHTDVVTVWTSTHLDRRYPNWSMGFDNLNHNAPEDGLESDWPEPNLALLPLPDTEAGDAGNYVYRRAAVLRPALYSGDRLMTTLAIILHGHRPETILGPDGHTRLHCAECRIHTGTDQEHYPCSTAKNAIWALESALPQHRP